MTSTPVAPGLFGVTVDVDDLDMFLDEYAEITEPTEAELELYLHILAVRKELVESSGDAEYFSAIANHHFRAYAEQLAEDIGALNRDVGWPQEYIDWDAATNALKQDYTSIDIAGTEYWYR